MAEPVPSDPNDPEFIINPVDNSLHDLEYSILRQYKKAWNDFQDNCRRIKNEHSAKNINKNIKVSIHSIFNFNHTDGTRVQFPFNV